MKNIQSLHLAVLFLLICLLATPALVTANQSREARLQERHDRLAERQALIHERRQSGSETEEDDHGGSEGGGHDNGNPDDDHGDDNGHGHTDTIEAADPIPTIDLIVHEDPKSGYNLEIVTEHYTFAPQNASTEHVDGEGHAHLYIDGEKITRIYGNWFYVAALPAGEHTFRVELSANNHSTYAHNGVLIDDSESIVAQ